MTQRIFSWRPFDPLEPGLTKVRIRSCIAHPTHVLRARHIKDNKSFQSFSFGKAPLPIHSKAFLFCMFPLYLPFAGVYPCGFMRAIITGWHFRTLTYYFSHLLHNQESRSTLLLTFSGKIKEKRLQGTCSVLSQPVYRDFKCSDNSLGHLTECLSSLYLLSNLSEKISPFIN